MDQPDVLLEEMVPPTIKIDLEEQREIARLARRLRPDNPVRQIAFALLERNTVEEETLAPLLKTLKAPLEDRWRERTVAAWAVGQWPLKAEQKAEVTDILGRIIMNRQLGRTDRFVLRLVFAIVRTALCSLVTVAACGFVLLSGALWRGSGILTLLAILLAGVSFILLACMPFLSFALDVHKNHQVRQLAVRSLGRLRQPLSTGVLANTIMDRNDNVSAEAIRAFRNILPLLSSTQYGQHDRETVPALCKLLFFYHCRPILRPFVVEAIGMIGGGEAVKPIEFVARTEKGTGSGKIAERILPILRERQQRENDPKRLVRAASAPDEPASLLLRPAQDSGSAEAHLLLRPIASDEDTR